MNGRVHCIPRGVSQIAVRLAGVTAFLCALGAVVVALMNENVLPAALGNSLFAVVALLAYVLMFLSIPNRDHSGVERVKPAASTVTMVLIACIGIVAAVTSMLVADWIPLAIGALVLTVSAVLLHLARFLRGAH